MSAIPRNKYNPPKQVAPVKPKPPEKPTGEKPDEPKKKKKE